LEIVARDLAFPEGACWSERDGCLYFVEYAGDRILALRGDDVEIMFKTPAGSGPCGLAQDGRGNLWTCLYAARQVVCYGLHGELRQVLKGYHGRRFRGPNDLVVDPGGGLYFTDSGDFDEDWRTGRPAGTVYYLHPDGVLHRIAGPLCYPNGIALSPDGRRLYVNEHRQNRVMVCDLPGGSVAAWGPIRFGAFCALDAACLLPKAERFQLGPDGMSCDRAGHLWVAHYGRGEIVRIDPAGQVVGRIGLPEGRKPTNTAVDAASATLYATEAECGLLYRVSLREIGGV